ncbi:GlxA family transcriptional regulator [Rhodococcus triatomae]
MHAFDGITLFHLAVPQLVFGEVTRQGLGDWSTVLWSQSGGDVHTAEGLRIGGLRGPDVVDDADVVVIPSWPEDTPVVDPDLRRLLVGAHRRGALVAGLCLGAIPVVDAGLLSGRSAVTHWAAMDRLSDRGDDVELSADVLYIDHGDVITSAGTASAIDACLHIVRRYLGAAKANRLARTLVVAPHREGGQRQYIDSPLSEPSTGNPVGETLEWAMTNLDEDLSIDRLAAHARMSRRSFIRRFREATGSTPARWIQVQRLSRARHLLESSDRGIEVIARAAGFGSSATFRQKFAAEFGIPPSAYRRQFGLAGEVVGPD